MSILLQGATIPHLNTTGLEAGGTSGPTDLRLEGGRITDVGTPQASNLQATAQDTVVDASGYLVLPAPAEPHAHLDKALTADLVVNKTGDLMGAIQAWIAHRETLTVEDIVDRATRAIMIGVSNGVTAFRSHVDVGKGIELTGLEALQQVKADIAPFASLEIVGLIGSPIAGPAGVDNLAIITDAVAAGLDIVGGVPHLDDDGRGCTRALLELAGNHGLRIDLHTDENLRLDSLDLEALAELVLETGFDQSVTASHCVALGMQSESIQQRVADKVAAARVSVITLPQTNLFLQSRDIAVAQPRGLTALAALHAAGVNVAGGADNLQDPFCTVGRGDPMETASLLVMAGHLTPDVAYDAVSNRARQVMGLESVTLEVDSPADLLLIKATTVREAIALAPADRIVFKAGQQVWPRPDGSDPTTPAS